MNGDPAEAAPFIDKWRERWPEWAIAQVFLPMLQRPVAEAWFAMVQEWTDAATTAEPAPGLAKLAWWQEELRGWGKGARRHPLGAALQRHPLEWDDLADALPALARRGHPAGDGSLDALPRRLSQAEQILFGEARDGEASIRNALRHALNTGDALEGDRDGTRPRRLLAGLQAARAASGNAPLPPWRTLACSWRSARAGMRG